MNGTKMLKPHWSFTLTTLEFTMEKINSCGVRAHCEEGIILSSCHEKIFSIQNSNVVCPKLECGLRCRSDQKIHFFSRGVARCIYIGDLHSDMPGRILMRSGQPSSGLTRSGQLRSGLSGILYHDAYRLDRPTGSHESLILVMIGCFIDYS